MHTHRGLRLGRRQAHVARAVLGHGSTGMGRAAVRKGQGHRGWAEEHRPEPACPAPDPTQQLHFSHVGLLGS